MLVFHPVQLLDLGHPTLLAVLEDLDHLIGCAHVTSFYRKGSSGVHGTLPVRGIDIRCRAKGIAEAVAGEINLRWEYDPERPQLQVAVAHDEGSGMHLHLQVHDHTERRNGD